MSDVSESQENNVPGIVVTVDGDEFNSFQMFYSKIKFMCTSLMHTLGTYAYRSGFYSNGEFTKKVIA